MPEEKVSRKHLVDRSLLDGIRNFMRRRFDQDRLIKYQDHFIREIDRIMAAPPAADAGPRQPSEVINEWISMLEHPDFGAVPSKKSMIDILRTIKQVITTNPPVPQEAAPDDDLIGKVDSKHLNDWATAPDWAMRVAVEQIQDAIGSIRVDGSLSVSDEWLAALIREAGSERERELREVLQKLVDYDTTYPADDEVRFVDAVDLAEASRLLGGESK